MRILFFILFGAFLISAHPTADKGKSFSYSIDYRLGSKQHSPMSSGDNITKNGSSLTITLHSTKKYYSIEDSKKLKSYRDYNVSKGMQYNDVLYGSRIILLELKDAESVDGNQYDKLLIVQQGMGEAKYYIK
ncbi:MAG: hypothetical protein KTR13_00780 [Saprospiraceae bacterium]|nr:hypothetical protein [Saprospiraceae bacterium]